MYVRKRKLNTEELMVCFCVSLAVSALIFSRIPSSIVHLNSILSAGDSAFGIAVAVAAILLIPFIIGLFVIFAAFFVLSLSSMVVLLIANKEHIIWIAPYSAIVITIGILRTIINLS